VVPPLPVVAEVTPLPVAAVTAVLPPLPIAVAVVPLPPLPVAPVGEAAGLESSDEHAVTPNAAHAARRAVAAWIPGRVRRARLGVSARKASGCSLPAFAVSDVARQQLQIVFISVYLL